MGTHPLKRAATRNKQEKPQHQPKQTHQDHPTSGGQAPQWSSRSRAPGRRASTCTAGLMSGGCPRRAERVTTSSGTPSAGSGGETTTSSGAPSAGGGSERVQSGSRGVQSGVQSWRGQRRGRDDGQRRAVMGYDRCGEDSSERAGTYDGRALSRASTGAGNDGGSAVVGLGDAMGSRGISVASGDPAG